MKRLLLALSLVAIAAPASAMLFCYDYLTAASWTWQRYPSGDHFSYVIDGVSSNTKPPQSFADPFAPIYCYANGVELQYIEKNLSVRTNVAPPMQPGSNGTVTWTGDDALYIWNNL